MRRLAMLTTLLVALAVALPAAAQDKQSSGKGGLGSVLDTLGNVLGGGTQKLTGTVVVNEGSTFVLRASDGRTYRVDTAALDPQKGRALQPGQAVTVTAHGGGQAGVLTATDVATDAKGGGKSFQTVGGTIQESTGQRVLFKTRDGLVVPVDVSNIKGLPYLAANQPATLYYEQGARQEIVGVWIQPGSSQAAASPATPAPASPSASVPSPQSLEGRVESMGVSELRLQTTDGRVVSIDTSGVDRQAMRAIAPGDTVTVTGQASSTPDRFVAQSVQPRR